ncbi:hypothetical protein SANA_10830 [Gottschalkiaceae bacterium SANA]|nr:hypothetical protein SANA_10830 [Gottschalkiaceae bacterium SANA]
MKLVNMLDERLIKFDLEVKGKDDAIKQVAKMMFDANKVNDLEQYIKGLFERETEFATGIGFGIAIPHCKDDCVQDAAFTIVKIKEPIEWGAMDENLVQLIIMLAAPNNSDNAHLKMLSKLSKNLMDEEFRSGLNLASSIEDIKKTFAKKGE